MCLHTDASQKGFGAILYKSIKIVWREIISYASAMPTDVEKKNISKLECLAVV